MPLIVQMLVLSSVVAVSWADVAENLALYQKTADRSFTDIQNNLNAQRQVYNQAFAKLNDDVNQSVDIKVRLAREQVQNECNRQVAELTRQLQELTIRSNSEKVRLQAELQTQSQNTDARIGEMSKNHQIELARVRSELNAINAQSLDNLRRQLEGQISVAQSEVNRIQTQHESALQNIQQELELTRQDGENSYRNAQRKIQQYV
ncbi:uncharacterized protein LOC119083843 [Bradysia coprophila]|uniref:uncharacterized protein LOC119083843 n=1 Tax=Bradysia coprophila TaxID=38358 RepID=UPI00187DAC34|nr:uncharacterized protein LOC119083843 [Bradysia coprophila]XP_037049544.1 uncharacterized protein LOC119083843 [Bradysia coprophila]